jgi:hypothetical protein
MSTQANIIVCQGCRHFDRANLRASPCKADPQKRSIVVLVTINGACPLGKHLPDGTPLPVATPPPAAAMGLSMTIVGPSMWRELHGRPTVCPDPAREIVWPHDGIETEWVNAFSRRLPCGECATEWMKLLNAAPPDVSSRDAYFVWTVRMHNAVNRRLGKAEFTVEAARAIYSFGGAAAESKKSSP